MPRPPPLHALTGLRYVAAIWVVTYHYSQPALGGVPILGDWIRAGSIAVPFFFVLSGFVLAYNYGDARVRWRPFMRRRVARLAPVYLVALAAVVVLLGLSYLATGDAPNGSPAGGERYESESLVASLLMVQAWVPQWACDWNCPGWSISVELVFYLLFPAMMLAVPGRPAARAGIAVATFALPGAYLAATVWAGAPNAGLVFHPLMHIPTFYLGVLLGTAQRESDAAMARRWQLPAALATLAVAVLVFRDVPWTIQRTVLYVPIMAWMVWAAAGSEGLGRARLSSPAMIRLGEASYSVYILQVPLYGFLMAGPSRLIPGWPVTPAVAGVLFPVVLTLASLGVYHWFEIPARRWIMDRPRLLQSRMPQS